MDSFWNWWNSLTPTAREAIVTRRVVTTAGDILLAIIIGCWKLLSKLAVGLLKLTQRLLNRVWPPAHVPELKPTETKPELTSAPPQISTAVPDSQSQDAVPRGQVSSIRRPPPVAFPRRYDSDGR